MSQSSDFKAFLTNKVNLNQTRLNLLSQRVTAIENFLTGDEVFGEYVTELIPQGSFAHGTIIKPVGNKEFDADVLVPMDEVDGWVAKDYVQKLYEAFGRSATYRSMRSRGKRCVTIDYAGDFHVDVVPFVTRDGSTYVTNRITEEFELAAPDDFTEWLEGKNRITNGNLVKVIRLLKYLRDHKTRYTIPSVTLTAALAHHVSETTKTARPGRVQERREHAADPVGGVGGPGRRPPDTAPTSRILGRARTSPIAGRTRTTGPSAGLHFVRRKDW